ncbi:hypothetical protein VTK56DRAFT_3930 [Thermocarpiscus australiensis]
MSLPPSSPRLPSPPPPAEIQIGPKSPLMGPNAARQASHIEQTAIDTNSKRRIHPGTKAADMAAGPPLVPLHELDSAFQLQEHLAALHYYHTSSHTTPITRETAKLLATPPPGTDKTLWLYELCRFLIAQCNSLIVGFLFDTPPCSASTCPEMRASEWQFLCAVHDAPKNCCAIDYCCHTLDWAANVVTNPNIFPSRFVVDAHDKSTALKNLVNVFRRLHRIFAHAWFQHRGVFWAVEGQTGLYVFFKTVCDIYDLLPAENYKLPPEAEGLDSSPEAAADRRPQQQQQQRQPQIVPTAIAKPPGQRAGTDDEHYPSVSRTNTRRHIKSSPSTGSAVTPVPETDEDDGAALSSRMAEMRISAPPAAAAAAAAGDEELELASIPVMVAHRPAVPADQPLRPSSVIPPAGGAAAGGTEPAPPEAEAQAEPKAEVAGGKQEIEAASAEHDQPMSEPDPRTQSEPELNKPVSEPEPELKTEHQSAPQPEAQGSEDQPAEMAGSGDEKAASEESGAHNDPSSTSARGEAEEGAKEAEKAEDSSSPSPAVGGDQDPGPESQVVADQGGGARAGNEHAEKASENETAADREEKVGPEGEGD